MNPKRGRKNKSRGCGKAAKENRFCWSAETMNAAVRSVADGSMTQRQASHEFNVPRSTLQKLLNGKSYIGARPGKKPVFGPELETKLADYAGNRAALGIGFGKRQFLEYAGQLAKKHRIKLKHSQPSDKWWRLIKKRNKNLRLRRPEGTAAVRHMCMHKDKVSKYFSALHGVLEKRGLLHKPSSIWNMDESGLQLQHVPRSVVARKGTRYLQSRTSGNKETITVIACINASGQKVPPHIIAKGKTQRALHGFDLKSAPDGAKWSVSAKGWTKQGIARLWFEETFLPNIGPDRPQVLILDGHDSHNFVELIELAIANNIEIVELPAHSSHWLQPCDRTVFKPLKDAYRDVCQQLMNDYPGVVVSKANFCGLLSKAWDRALTEDNIRSGFKACGIFPFNPDQIPSEAYLPNLLYVMDKDECERPAGAAESTEINALSGLVAEHESSSGHEGGSVGVDGISIPSVMQIQVEIHASQDGGQQESIIPNLMNVMQTDESGSSVAGNTESESSVTLAAGDPVVEDENSAVHGRGSADVDGHCVVSVGQTEVLADASDDDRRQEGVIGVERPCGIQLALYAVESAFAASQLNEYKTAYASGGDGYLMNDRLYLTWKGLKDADRQEQVSNASANSIDSIVLESAMALQEDEDFFQTTITVDDIEKALTTNSTTVKSYEVGPEMQTLPLSSEASHPDCLTPSRPILAEIFPFNNTSSPVDPDADILSYPEPQVRKKSRNIKRLNKKFFVLTSEEAFKSKLEEEATKAARENERVERKKKLDMRKEVKAKQTQLLEDSRNKKQKSKKTDEAKAKCRAVKGTKKTSQRKQKQKEVNWQCNGCQGYYFDSDNPKYQEDWVSCVECHEVHFHNSCAVGHGHFDNDDLEGDFTCSSCFI